MSVSIVQTGASSYDVAHHNFARLHELRDISIKHLEKEVYNTAVSTLSSFASRKRAQPEPSSSSDSLIRPIAPKKPRSLDKTPATDADTHYQKGVHAYRKHKNPHAAIQHWIQAAKNDHSGALYELGNRLYFGEGTPKNQSHAIKLWEAAADKGDELAITRLGIGYVYGVEGILEGNVSKGLRLLSRLAGVDGLPSAKSPNCAEAQYHLGLYYYTDHGYGSHKALAFYWWQHAAQSLHKIACFNLGCCYFNGEGTSIDPNLAVKWWIIAHKLKVQTACDLILNCRTMARPLSWSPINGIAHKSHLMIVTNKAPPNPSQNLL